MRNRSKANVVDSASQFFEGRQSDNGGDGSRMKFYGCCIIFVFAFLVIIGVTVEMNRIFSSYGDNLHGGFVAPSIDGSASEDSGGRENEWGHSERGKKILRSSQSETVAGRNEREYDDEDLIESRPQDAVGLGGDEDKINYEFASQEHPSEDRHIRSDGRHSMEHSGRIREAVEEPVQGAPRGHRDSHHDAQEAPLERHVGPAATHEDLHRHHGDLDPVDPDFGIGGSRKFR